MSGKLPGSVAIVGAILCVVRLAGAVSGASLFGLDADSTGNKIDRGHADRSRWSNPSSAEKPPMLALLWFWGDYQANEVEVSFDGWMRTRTTKILEQTRRDTRVDPETFSVLTNLIQQMPPGTNDIAGKSHSIRVSWQNGADWVSRTYDQASPPAELLKLYRFLGVRFDFICQTLAESAPATVKEFSGPVRVAGAACDRGLVLALPGEGRIALLDPYQRGQARYFPAAFTATNRPSGIAVTPDGVRIADAIGPVLSLRELETGKELWRGQLPPDPRGLCLALAPDGSRLLAGCAEGLFLYDTATNGEPRLLSRGRFDAVDWSRDGRWIAAARDTSVSIRDSSGKEVCAFTNLYPVSAVAFSPDSTRLAASQALDIQVFDLRDRKLAFEIPCWTESFGRLDSSPVQLAWSPDGKILAVKNYPGTLVLCDVVRRAPIAMTRQSLVTPVAFDRKGVSLVAVGVDNNIHCWELRDLGAKR